MTDSNDTIKVVLIKEELEKIEERLKMLGVNGYSFHVWDGENVNTIADTCSDPIVIFSLLKAMSGSQRYLWDLLDFSTEPPVKQILN